MCRPCRLLTHWSLASFGPSNGQFSVIDGSAPASLRGWKWKGRVSPSLLLRNGRFATPQAACPRGNGHSIESILQIFLQGLGACLMRIVCSPNIRRSCLSPHFVIVATPCACTFALHYSADLHFRPPSAPTGNSSLRIALTPLKPPAHALRKRVYLH